MKFLDLTGKQFSRLNVVSQIKNGPIRSYWECLCTCGESTQVRGNNLTTGKVRSCGCLSVETARRKATKHGLSTKYPKEYESWKSMRYRCKNGYRNKVKVCKRWNSFSLFMKDMGLKSPAKPTIERLDNNGDYTPSNCVWASYKTQGRNKINNRLITFNGRTLCLAEWAEELSIPRLKLLKRLNRGWSIGRAFTTH